MKKMIKDFNIKTADEARLKAIDWQHWASEKSLSLYELSEWQDYFTIIGRRFNLIREFKENCII